MSAPELEALFDAFRARGDAAALEQVFDRTAPELLRVASHLAPDLAEAEDLVQATFVTAIERAASYDDERPLFGWLLGILANQARNARRRSARRPDPKELARAPGADPADELERRELSGELRAAIDSLPQLYRDVLAAHLVDGKRAVDIARETARAAGTVRMQIARGLELVRRALPAGVVAGAASLQPRTRGLAAVRTGVMEVAREAVVPIAAGGAVVAGGAKAIGVGGIVVGVKTWVGVAVGLVVLALSIARLAAEPDAARGTDASALAPAPDALPPPVAQPETANAAPTPREELAPSQEIAYAFAPPTPDPDAPGLWLTGTISGLGRELEQPLSVHVSSRDGGSGYAVTEAYGDGPYEVELGPLFDAAEASSRELMVSFGHFDFEARYVPLHVPAELLHRAAGERRELRLDVELVPMTGFRGRVTLPDGAAAEGADVFVLLVDESGAPRGQALSIARADSNGDYALMTSERGACLVVAFLHGHAPETLAAEIPETSVESLSELRLRPSATSIRGRVQLPPACVGMRARVYAWRASFDAARFGEVWGSLELVGDHLVPGIQRAWCDAEGRFEVGGLEAGEPYWLAVDELEGDVSVLRMERKAVRAPSEGVILGQSMGLVTVQLLGDGAPLAQAQVAVEVDGTQDTQWTDEEGRARALVEMARSLRVRARAEGWTAGEVELPAAERTPDDELQLLVHSRAGELATLELEPVLVAGHGLPDPEVQLHRVGTERDAHPSGRPFERRGQALVIDGLEPGTYEVSLQAGTFDVGLGARCCYLPAILEVELAPGATVRERVPLELGGAVSVRVEGADASVTECRCELVDARGEPVAVRYVTSDQRGGELIIGSRQGVMSLETGNALHPALPAGVYELRATIPGYRVAPLRFSVTAGSVQELTLEVTPE